jgi:hypothetical protein
MENKSINQLMGTSSNKDIEQSSYLVQRVEQLCDVPISEFEVEDYRIIINQGIALEYLVSPAIEMLYNNLFAEGDYYEGDLLKAVLTIDKSFWIKHPNLKERLKDAILREFKNIDAFDLTDEIKDSLNDSVDAFLSNG